jgi:hypothetical protein
MFGARSRTRWENVNRMAENLVPANVRPAHSTDDPGPDWRWCAPPMQADELLEWQWAQTVDPRKRGQRRFEIAAPAEAKPVGGGGWLGSGWPA